MDPEPAASKALLAWQKRLLPFMQVMLVALTLLAGISNAVEVWLVQRHIQQSHEIDLNVVWDSVGKSDVRDPFAVARWKTLALLENDAMERRYHQGTAIIMSRVYIIFLGFVTGMVMALVGATFILGKLESSESKLSAESAGWKGALQSSSPGLMLCVLGTILIVSAIFGRAEVNVYDTNVYLPKSILESTPATPNAGAQSDSSSPTDLLKRFKERKPASK
jgi:hypothetical protein